MELPALTTAQALCVYRHPAWGGIPAVTRNSFGSGAAAYLAACFSPRALDAVLESLLPSLGVAVPEERFPLIVKRGVNPKGERILFLFNFSPQPLTAHVSHPDALSLPDGASMPENCPLSLPPWGAVILKSQDDFSLPKNR